MTTFRDIVDKYHLRKAIVDFEQSRSSDDPAQNERIQEDGIELIKANAVSSLITDGPFKGLHLPVLDIDMECWVGPSSTPGNHHLIIGQPMSFARFDELMSVMAEAGILQPGYVGAAVRREQTWIRTPWTRK